MAEKKFFGGGQLKYSCTRRNYKIVRRSARQAEAKTDCDLQIRCLGKVLGINFLCSSGKAFEKAGDLFFGLLDRARAEGELAGKKKRRR